jgi:nitroreductase
MEVREALRSTASLRDFTDEPVGDDVLTSILDDARFAPSGGNRQPWRVAVVKDTALRRQLADLMQVVWDEYIGARAAGATPFAFGRSIDAPPVPTPNPLLSGVERVPAVLAIAADLNDIALMDGNLDRPAVVGGASVYPFCWNILLGARDRGLGGVMTTFLSRQEPVAAPLLGLPDGHALAATIFLGHVDRFPTKLRRRPVSAFATINRFDGPPLTD